METKPRAYTEEEVREKFLRHIWHVIDYWDKESRASDARSKMEGVCHSILAMMDGSCMNLPAFVIAPLPHPDDKAYHIAREENFYPPQRRDKETGAALGVKCDIGGNLAYQLFRVREKMQAEAKQGEIKQTA